MCISITALSSDAHKTPYKFKCTDSSKHKTIDQDKAWKAKVGGFFLLEINDESKGRNGNYFDSLLCQ